MENIYEYNKKVEEELTKNGNLLSDYGYAKLGKFKCQCGSYLSPATLRYYNYNVNKAQCFTCQGIAYDKK